MRNSVVFLRVFLCSLTKNLRMVTIQLIIEYFYVLLPPSLGPKYLCPSKLDNFCFRITPEQA